MNRSLGIGAALLLLNATITVAQESRLQAEFRLEAEHLKEDCGSLKTLPSCATTLITDHPVHMALGSIAPQNGFGFGPALSTHFTPSENWRNTWSSDAVFAPGGAWRAGTYFKAIHTNVQLPTVGGVISGGPLIRITEYPILSGYVQAISLPQLAYYGIGSSSSEGDKTIYGMSELIVGGGATVPLRNFARPLNMAVFAEMNGRIFDIKPGTATDVPEIDDRFDESSAPGLNAQPAFVQFGEGIRIRPAVFNDRLRFNYTFNLQQFISPQSFYSFGRWTVDLNHEIPVYRTNSPTLRRETNSPNECALSPSNHDCPSVTRDRWGTIGFRFLASKSLIGNDGAVPFYLQRTLGGSDIDGNRALASYSDYRFRGPHLLLFQETFEHSIFGPMGVFLEGNQGKVVSQTDPLDVHDLRHSTTVGLTLRAGGFPVITASWSTGGREGNHVIVTMDTSLLGGGGRPAVQ